MSNIEDRFENLKEFMLNYIEIADQDKKRLKMI